MFKSSLWFCALISFNVTAQSGTCEWGQSVLNVGESVWVEAPNLVNQVGSRDWSGYRVECTYTYSLVAMEANGEEIDVIEQREAKIFTRSLSRFS